MDPGNAGSFLTIVSFDEQAATLHVAGDEDRDTQSRRRQALAQALCSHVDELTVDLSDLVFADSSVMLDLAMLARRLRLRDKRLVLRGAQPPIERLIEFVGMDRLPGVVVGAADGR